MTTGSPARASHPTRRPGRGRSAPPSKAVNSATTGLWSLRPVQRDPVTTRQETRRAPQAEGTKMPSQW